MEISRATKFLLDRGVTAFIKLEGDLEILCCVEIQMPPTLKNREIIDLYKSMIDLSYDSCEKDFAVGSFLLTNEEIESTLAACSSSASKKKENGKREPSARKIRHSVFFPFYISCQ